MGTASVDKDEYIFVINLPAQFIVYYAAKPVNGFSHIRMAGIQIIAVVIG